MLNKKLLITTKGQTEGSIKLTVSKHTYSLGYSKGVHGSVSKVPYWHVNEKPGEMIALFCQDTITFLMLSDYKPADDPLEITVTVVEKGLTVTLERDEFFGYTIVGTEIFNSSDIGKTFTIVFDPEPTGYV